VRVVLRNNAIFVQGGNGTLEEPWMEEFFDHHIQNTLFLDNGVLVLNSESASEQKEDFLDSLTDSYTKANDLSSPFYRRSLKKCRSAAIRIEMPYRKTEKIDIELFAFGPSRVKITFLDDNRWVMRYLKQQFSSMVLSSTNNQIYIDVSSMQSKARLEKALNRKEVLHYQINYTYDNDFMAKLYGQFSGFGFNNEEMDKMIAYHAIFEIPMGSRPKDLKKQYLKLAKRYHPDSVSSKSPAIVNSYTEKFKLLQEAYDALRLAS
jgi:DnaJ-domain-containing protein 1